MEIKTPSRIPSEKTNNTRVNRTDVSSKSLLRRRRDMETEFRKRQIMIWYTVVAVIGVLLVQYFWASYSQIETIPYSSFERLLSDGIVAEVTVGAESVEGILKEALPSGRRAFYTVRVEP